MEVWVYGVSEIDHDGPSRLVIVGEQQPAIRHPILRMVHLVGADSGGGRGNQLPVSGRIRISVDNGNKVLAAICSVASPGEKIVSWLSWPCGARYSHERGR